jgi:hypothetical protein
MCYGDVAYGTDGHYQRYLEEAEADAWERRIFDESEYVEIGAEDAASKPDRSLVNEV